MKHFITLLSVLFFLTGGLYAQQQDPVHWTYSAEKTGDKTYLIHIKPSLDEGWHIYAQVQPREAISVPTKIVFIPNPLVKLKGATRETGEKETYRDTAAGIVQYQYKKVEFVQMVTLKANVRTNLRGSVTYQACTNKMCLPEKTVEFNIPIQ